MIEQITYYLQGRLTEKESLVDLWEHLLMNEADLEIMTIYWMLRLYFTEELNYAQIHKILPKALKYPF